MPKSIDAQIDDTRARIVKYNKRLAALLIKKREIVTRRLSTAQTKEVDRLISNNVAVEDIIAALKPNIE